MSRLSKEDAIPWESLTVARTRAGLNRSDLARRAEMNLSHLSLVEQGRIRPRTATVGKIAAALGLAPTDIPLPVVENPTTVRRLDEQRVREIIREEIEAYVAAVQRGEV